jgi:hypothetical protein
MKRLIIIVVILTLLVSCATKKHCDAYGNKSSDTWNENVTSA